jgi:glucose/mannose transport system substrate-binding protein
MADVDVELFSWWIAAGESDALQALLDLHHANYPHENVVNAAIAGGVEAKDILAKRIKAGNPPDLYQENAYALPLVMMNNPGSLSPVTSLFQSEGLTKVVIPELIEAVTVDGEMYGMPVNVHRESAIHYNKKLFADNGVDVTTTLDEFLAACETFKKAGVTPLATSYAGWILRILFNGLLPASLGFDAFKAYFVDKGDFPEAAFVEAIKLLDNILTNYTNQTDENFLWNDCADLVFDGQAAMFIHGDWVKGYFTAIGWTPGEGFGVTSAPDASNIFFMGVDTFALLKGDKQPDAAQDFLRTVASKEGQVAFNKIKGSSPMRLDAPTKNFDVVAQATMKILGDPQTLRLSAPANVLWDNALQDFAKTRDQDALLAVYRDNRAAGM